MALIGALLLSLLLSTALGGMTVVATIERRASSGFRQSLELRAAVHGAIALGVAELDGGNWEQPLAGSGSVYWRAPAPGFDLAGVTARLRAEAMMSGAHGADTPFWQVFAQSPWPSVTGRAGRIHVVSWIADDFTEADGEPRADSNGRLMIRALAFAGEAEAWGEAVCGRAEDGRIRLEHIRTW